MYLEMSSGPFQTNSNCKSTLPSAVAYSDAPVLAQYWKKHGQSTQWQPTHTKGGDSSLMTDHMTRDGSNPMFY